MAVLGLHELLDTTERVVLESFQTKDPKKDEYDRDHFIDSLYRPSKEDLAVAGSGHKPKPIGFEEEDTADAFDAAMLALGAE
jgi:hypothetical protein